MQIVNHEKMASQQKSGRNALSIGLRFSRFIPQISRKESVHSKRDYSSPNGEKFQTREDGESLDLKKTSWAILCSHRSSLKKVGKVGSPGPPHICLNLSKNVVLETKATKPKLGKNVNGRLPLENGNFLALDQYSTHLQKNIRHCRRASEEICRNLRVFFQNPYFFYVKSLKSPGSITIHYHFTSHRGLLFHDFRSSHV